MSKDITKNTCEYVNENGKFKKGNKGKPKGATNKTTRELREFITNFLNDKAYEIPHIWNALDDKDKATLFLHLCKLVLPKTTTEQQTPKELQIFHGIDLSVKEETPTPVWKVIDGSKK